MKHQNGFTLLEVLLTLAFFSAAFIGMSQLQLLTTQANQISYQYQLAYAATYNLAELLSMTSDPVIHDRLIQSWQSGLPDILPSGAGEIVTVGVNADIRINWEGPRNHPLAYCENSLAEYCVNMEI